MMVKKYLLVCEGPTDIRILDEISKSLTAIGGHKIELVPLSPQEDKTSGQYPPQGWSAVRAWCMANRKKTNSDVAHLAPALRNVAQRKNWSSLVAASGAAGLIVQIDTDIADLISDLPQSFANSGLPRKEYTRAAVLDWLNISSYPVNSLYLVLSTYSTESWVLACHEPTDSIFSDLTPGFSYEDLSDVEDRLVAKGLKSKIKRGRRRLDKSKALYQAYATQIVSSLQNVRSRCQAAEDYCFFLEND
jgi:hypothetical protein